MATGKCVIPEGLHDNARVKLTSNCNNKGTRFMQTSGLSMKHLQTGKCIHPLGGSLHPAVNTDIVIYNGCNERRLLFLFKYDKPAPTFVIKHYSGLCLSLRESDNRLRLCTECTDKFLLTSNSNLKHVATGQCVIPESLKDNARVKLTSNCNDKGTKFMHTPGLSVKHLQTGKCIHPLGGSLHPVPNTEAVIHAGCNEKRLEFEFICW